MHELVMSVIERDFDKIKKLLQQGYDLNTPYNEYGYTPFHLAVYHPFPIEVVKELINLGADVNQPIKDGRTPIMLSCISRIYPNVLKLLINCGADINAQDKDGYTALMQVLKKNKQSVKNTFANILIDNGSDLTKLKNNQGQTALDMMINGV